MPARGCTRADREVLLGDGVGVRRAVGAVEGVDLLAEHRPLQRPAGLALLVRGQTVGQNRVLEQQGARVVVAGAGFAVVLAGIALVGEAREEARDAVAPEVDAGVEPGARQDRRDVRRFVEVRRGDGWCCQRRQLLGVPLLDQAEAAELALDAVEVPVVVGVAA